MKIKKILLEILVATLVILFVYTPVSKLMQFTSYVKAMKAQPLLPYFAQFLVYAVPVSELLAVILIVVPKTRRIGLYFTLGLLLAFTGYIILIQAHYYGRIPCTCGGVISSLTWGQHAVFNAFFMIITLLSIMLERIISKNETNNRSMNYQQNGGVYKIV